MMYKCENCGALFTEPFSCIERENLDGENGIYYAQRETCPYCGEEWFTETNEAENF